MINEDLLYAEEGPSGQGGSYTRRSECRNSTATASGLKYEPQPCHKLDLCNMYRCKTFSNITSSDSRRYKVVAADEPVEHGERIPTSTHRASIRA